MTKLWELNIEDTNIDSGLEYLPESVERFYCWVHKRENTKCNLIYNLFANEQGIVETGQSGNKEIKNFPQKLQDYKQWRKFNFSEEEIRQWIAVRFTLNDYEIANQFKQKYQPNIPVEEIIKKEAWQDIHPGFNYQSRKAWESKDFDKEQTKEWIEVDFQPSNHDYVPEWKNQGFTPQETKSWTNAGVKLDDYKFIAWLRDIKNYGPEWISNYKEDYQVLSNRFKKYGLCSECKQPNTGEQWCKDCNNSHLFAQPASSNPKINEFIQKYQLEATDKDKFLEWIPYEQFEIEKDKEVHGVMPYVAPELLNKKKDEVAPYTPASDIYSLGMITYEIFANQSPYLDRNYDESLALSIVCDELRPNLEEVKIPQLLKDLIKKCWDNDPAKRPTTNEIEKTLRSWQKDAEFTNQLRAIEAEYNQVSQNSIYKKHPTANMASKLINTKLINQLSQQKKRPLSLLFPVFYPKTP